MDFAFWHFLVETLLANQILVAKTVADALESKGIYELVIESILRLAPSGRRLIILQPSTVTLSRLQTPASLGWLTFG